MEVKPGIVFDLVDVDFLEVAAREEIHPRHPAQRERLERLHRHLANLC